ncbi:hypothetical protein K1719_000036 [Acacia pycnantha]|nr:hypothetical protein K1719_000036 [Acacia pycnantha]
MADNGFKSGFANALQLMMEEKLPECGIKACPHITSSIKTLKKLWQMAYDMVYGPNTLGFGWDPDTKCVTANKDVWDEYIKTTKPLSFVFNLKQNHSPVKHSFLQPPRMARVKMTEERMKEMGITIDDVKEYRRQRGIEKKEVRKKQRKAKNKGDATVSQKRKEPPQVDPNSAAPP